MIKCEKCGMPFLLGEEKEKVGKYGKFYQLPCGCNINKYNMVKLIEIYEGLKND